MSAPNEGRQSPEPQRQSDSQQAMPAEPRKEDGSTASGNSEGHNDTSKLASNPEHPLEKQAEEKTSKTGKWSEVKWSSRLVGWWYGGDIIEWAGMAYSRWLEC